jgi:hypothetical protein
VINDSIFHKYWKYIKAVKLILRPSVHFAAKAWFPWRVSIDETNPKPMLDLLGVRLVSKLDALPFG